jgi:hypothetical protein
MIEAPAPDSEEARLRALHQLEILDTEVEKGLTQLSTLQPLCAAHLYH